MTIIWCMVPEIWSATDRIFCHSGLFFALVLWAQKIKILKKWKEHVNIFSFYKCVPQMTVTWSVSWDMECNEQNFLSFWTVFCPFTPLTTWKIKILETPEDIIILHRWTINDSHMRNGSWDMECWRTEFFVNFMDHFFPFFPSNNQKNQNFEKM